MTKRSIAQLLSSEIENFSLRLRREHPLMAAAQQGKVEPTTVLRYLVGIRYLLRHSLPHLELASDLAASGGLVELAGFFRIKREQEAGHDIWAENDIAEMVRRYQLTCPEPPTSMTALVAYVETIIRKDPSHYLAYVLLAELFTVQAGTAWVEALVGRCGIPRSALTAISKHVELDQHHVAEGIREIDLLLGEVSDPEPILAALRGAMTCFEEFFEELYQSRPALRRVG